MAKEYPERRVYRKSPGRQYEYEHDPLRSRGGQGEGGQGRVVSRSGSLASQRPDLRRTRHLIRENILASKRPLEEDEQEELLEPYEEGVEERAYDEEFEESTPYSRRHPSRRSPISPSVISTSDLELAGAETEEDLRGYEDYDYEEDSDLLDYEQGEDPLAQRVQPGVRRPIGQRGSRVLPPPEEEYEDDYEEEERQVRRKPRKKKVTRRGLLLGAGAVVVGGTAIAAVELGPKIPQAVNNVGTNIEKQLQDAFNEGVAQGADQARREILGALDNLEGFTLEGAIAAARLTRVAYDVFVSPVVKFGATLTGDFLNGMLRALKTARGWLQGAYQDNASLEAIQKVLESWVGQVSSMPKQLDAITQTDLDGAQAYLRALQRKLDEEKAKLNKPAATPGATPAARPTQKAQ